MTAEQLAALAGTVLSLALSYIPGLSTAYGNLDTTAKRLVMGVLLVAVSVGAFALACGNVIADVTCDRGSALGLVSALIAALVANQATFLISPRRAH